MAKKKEELAEPVISSIPVPPSDSALVIDLPDGQKLLVGKIESGTVIEVATWRGTGRPDSRTNRLMLGMSSESDVKKPEATEAPTPVSVKDLKFPQNFLFVLINFSKKVIPVIKKILKNLHIKFNKSDFKKLKLPKIKKPTVSKDNNKIQETPETKSSLKIEDDFDIDFQRILDEVSQRRTSKPSQPPKAKGASTKKVSQKSNNPKKNEKKSSKRAR